MLHGAAALVEAGWHNEGFDSKTNGEDELLRRLRSADIEVVFDVGANIGDWSRTALDTWPACQVHSFEIAPPTFARLEARVRNWSDAHRAHPHATGVSDAPGTQRMYFYPEDSNLTSAYRRHEGLAAESFDAAVVSLDRFCADKGIERIGYLKVDVEGTEHRVLQGATGLLAANKVDCIQFEYGAFAIDTRVLLKDYFALLADMYVIGKIFPGHVEFRDYDWQIKSFRFANYLAVSRTRPDLQRLAAGH